MKILLVHNFYGSSAPSGENTVFIAEKELLRQHGHTIIEFTRHSDDIRNKGVSGLIKGAFAAPWNPFSQAELRCVLQAARPDVMHVHNTFPLLSPAVFYATRNLDTAVVLTLHNYRLFCAAGIPMRDNLPCTLCLDKKRVMPALQYGCYRNSRAATLPMALMIALHRRMNTWHRQVDAFIALTAFQKTRMAEAGLPEDRIHIKSHFYPNPPIPRPWKGRDPRVVYIGRIGTEKGVHVLMDAWHRWGSQAPVLEIIGDGPERRSMEKMAVETNAAGKIRFIGQLPFDQAQERLSKASLLVLPSLCFEGFPMVIREAFASGVPVATSRLGSMPDIVTDGKNGILVDPGSGEDLFQKIRALWQAPDRLKIMAENARQEFEDRYTAENNYNMLMGIYKKAIRFKGARP